MPKPTAFVRKRHEYDDVYSLWFRNPGLRYEAGRYAHVLVGKVWLGDAVRELSFASAPYEAELMFTVHLGSGTRYKNRLEALRPGDQVRVFLTGGDMVLPREPVNQPLVLIAGGVGMAPFRSLILEAHRRGGLDLRVIQVQRGRHLFRDELEPLVAHYTGVQPEDFLDCVRAQAVATPEALFYICGSDRLVTAARSELLRLAVAEHRMRIENFH